MKKFIIVFITTIYSILLLISLFYFLFNLKIFCEREFIKYEINDVRRIIDSNEFEIDKLRNKFEKNITTGNNLIIEQAIENYLLDTLTFTDKIQYYEKYLIDTNVTSITDLSILENYKDEIDALKESINNLDSKYYISQKTSNDMVKQEYEKFLSSLFGDYDLKEKCERISISIDKVIAIASFLKNNELYYKIEDETIVFLKRSVYDLYKINVNDIDDEYIISIYDYKLIEDTEGPIIDASGINILVGTKYNFAANVKCHDEVDDAVDCVVEGSYDVNTPGSYKMVVSAADLSGNTTKKDIVINVNEPEKPTGPYYIEIIRNYSTVIVYGLDDYGNYTNIVQVFPASVGAGGNTPLGTYKTTKGSVWGGLYGGVYGQYTTRIVGSILFHSVPYYSKDKSTLWWQEYNNLGIARSMGCVRLTVKDSKWIYDNCPSGTTVRVVDKELPEGVTKPEAPKIDPDSPNRGWDPTDPDPANPWNN